MLSTGPTICYSLMPYKKFGKVLQQITLSSYVYGHVEKSRKMVENSLRGVCVVEKWWKCLENRIM